MKQKITIDQWRELSKEQQNYLIEWYSKREQDLSTIPYFTIGELIEFLGREHIFNAIIDGDGDIYWVIGKENICDALWKEVKQVLENLNLPKGKMESKYVFMAERINKGVSQYCLCQRYLKEEEIMKILDNIWQNESGSKSNALLEVFVK